MQGHVDGTGEFLALDALGDDNWWLRIRVPAELDRYLVFKGSIAIDGISLTIAALEGDVLSVTIIPHTYRNTTLGGYRAGARVNLECDILAKHVEKLLAQAGSEGAAHGGEAARERILRCGCFPCSSAVASIACAQQPSFTFAVLTDIQYGDQPDAGKREYRRSLGKLHEAVDALNRRGGLAFAIQLGDLIDSKMSDVDTVLPVWRSLRTRTYDVPGNHDFGFVHGHAEFTQPGWRFLVLDGMDLSVNAGSPAAAAMLRSLKESGAANAQDWNGGIGPAQLEWLRETLARAAAATERVIVFCHFPLVAASSTPAHLLWNHEAVRRIIDASPAVAAWFAGHDHNGGYALERGIHYVTFPGMVESGAATAYTVVRVFADRLELDGTGTAPSRILKLR